MASRPRSRTRKGWPAYLYEKDRGGPYYYWRHPKTGQEFGLGRDLMRAKLEAMEANLKLAELEPEARLVDRISGKGETVSDFLPVYREVVKARGVAANTIKTMETNLRKIDAGIGSMVMTRVTAKDMHDNVIQPMEAADNARAASQALSFLTDVWMVAATKGKVTDNPAKLLKTSPVKVKRERWTLETFMQAYEAALGINDRWIARCMKLALVTAQPRECLIAWEFSDARDGFLWNERGKTGARIKLPLNLTLPGVGWRLDDCIKECRDSTLSRHMLHHNVRRTKSNPGDPISLNAASKGIQRARERAELTWPDGRLPPTLHEIRSLSLRIYRDAYGRDFAQSIAGHKQGTTTDIYTDSRGAEWVEVQVG